MPPALPTIEVRPIFIDNLMRCALPCAPMQVVFACQAPGRLKCKCADGVDVEVAQPVQQPQGWRIEEMLGRPAVLGLPAAVTALRRRCA